MIPIFINGEQLRYFDQLNERAQAVARRGYIEGNRRLVLDKIAAQRAALASDTINSRVNDQYHIRRLGSGLRLCKTLETGTIDALDRSILSNVAMFNEAGDYYLFSVKKFVSELDKLAS